MQNTRHRNDRQKVHTHTPKPLCEHEDVTVLWNQWVDTDREVTPNRPDVVIKKKREREKTCILLDVAVLSDRNVTQKEAEKKLKYNSLCIEVQRMWNMKCMIILLLIEATAIVIKGLKKNLEVIPGQHCVASLQKTAVLGTSHIIRTVLQSET